MIPLKAIQATFAAFGTYAVDGRYPDDFANDEGVAHAVCICTEVRQTIRTTWDCRSRTCKRERFSERGSRAFKARLPKTIDIQKR